MRKYLLFSGFLLIMVFLTSCRPEGVLSRKDMTDLLYDVHMAEAIANPNLAPVPEKWRKGLEPDYFRDMSYHSVLRKYKISEEQFYKSVAYYSKNLRLYTKIYTDIDKRMKTFSQDVTDWKYHTPTAEEFYKNANLDTVKIRSLFCDQHFHADTSKTKGFNIIPDSVISWVKWKTREWLSEENLIKEKFYVINPKDYIDLSQYESNISVNKDSVKMHDLQTPKKDVEINKEGTVVVSF
jgi:hypothetical protein